jgi:hypothetical protein
MRLLMLFRIQSQDTLVGEEVCGKHKSLDRDHLHSDRGSWRSHWRGVGVPANLALGPFSIT